MITSVNNQLLVLRCPKHQFFYLAMPWSSLVMTSNICFFDNQTKSVFKNNPSLFLHCETTKENLTSNLDQSRLIVCKLILKTKNPNICTAKWFFFFELSATRWKTCVFVYNLKRVDYGMLLMLFLNSSPQKTYLGKISELELKIFK